MQAQPAAVLLDELGRVVARSMRSLPAASAARSRGPGPPGGSARQDSLRQPGRTSSGRCLACASGAAPEPHRAACGCAGFVRLTVARVNGSQPADRGQLVPCDGTAAQPQPPRASTHAAGPRQLVHHRRRRLPCPQPPAEAARAPAWCAHAAPNQSPAHTHAQIGAALLAPATRASGYFAASALAAPLLRPC
jgi:hypothetical protein